MQETRSKILCISLNTCIDRGIEVPGFAIGAHQTGRQIYRRCAGKPINVACGLGMFEIPADVLGFVGKAEKEWFETELHSNNVISAFFPVEGSTRENITIIDPVRKTETHIRDRGFEISRSDYQRMKKTLIDYCQKDAMVIFSGSLPMGLEQTDFVELVQLSRMNGARVTADVSGKMLQALKHLDLWLVKPNVSELSEYAERELTTFDEIVSAGRELTEHISYALISMGKEGALLIGSEIMLRGKVSMDESEVKNTVGCGDALLCGFIAGMEKGKSLEDSLALGLATGSAAAGSISTGDISREQVERYIGKVSISRI
jgi:1-phosphofructokinase family hexose kinase